METKSHRQVTGLEGKWEKQNCQEKDVNYDGDLYCMAATKRTLFPVQGRAQALSQLCSLSASSRQQNAP